MADSSRIRTSRPSATRFSGQTPVDRDSVFPPELGSSSEIIFAITIPRAGYRAHPPLPFIGHFLINAREVAGAENLPLFSHRFWSPGGRSILVDKQPISGEPSAPRLPKLAQSSTTGCQTQQQPRSKLVHRRVRPMHPILHRASHPLARTPPAFTVARRCAVRASRSRTNRFAAPGA